MNEHFANCTLATAAWSCSVFRNVHFLNCQNVCVQLLLLIIFYLFCEHFLCSCVRASQCISDLGFSVAPKILPENNGNRTILLVWIFYSSLSMHACMCGSNLCSMWFRFHIYFICISSEWYGGFWLNDKFLMDFAISQHVDEMSTPKNTQQTKKIISHFERGMSLHIDK